MNAQNPTPTAEPPIARRCSWTIDPDFVGAYRNAVAPHRGLR
jgi:hypothetical protein